MFELNDNSYVVGFWFSSNPISEDNWLGMVIRDPDNHERFIGEYRFRYTRDNKIFDSTDVKKWQSFAATEGTTEEDVIIFMNGMQDAIIEGYPDKDQMIVKGGLDKLIELAKEKHWMNIRTTKIPEGA